MSHEMLPHHLQFEMLAWLAVAQNHMAKALLASIKYRGTFQFMILSSKLFKGYSEAKDDLIKPRAISSDSSSLIFKQGMNQTLLSFV